MPPDAGFRRAFFHALRDRPLDLSDPADRALYVPLQEGDHDPVVRLYDTIELSGADSVQLVGGYRGTGKTTEFSRLRRALTERGYVVAYVDLEEHVDMHSPVNVTDFLLVMMSSVTETLVQEGLIDHEAALEETWSERVWDFLKREVDLGGAVSVAGVSLKLGLKGDQSLRQRLRAALAGKVPQLAQAARAYHETLLGRLRDRWGDDAQLVVILDHLEHLRGTGDDVDSVHQSVEELFLTHGKHLVFPRTHLIFSVPAFLLLKADNLAAEFGNGAIQTWSTCRVRDPSGAPARQAIDRLFELVERRGDWRQILPDRAALEEIVLASGGYIRDLLNMLIEALHLARKGVAADAAEQVIEIARRAYLPIYADELDVLRRIARSRSLSGVRFDERHYLTRFLDAHLVLCYANRTLWYDVHPLVRDIVTRP